MFLNAFIKKDPLIMTSSFSEFKPILDKCSRANTWILYIARIFQKINCERISLWIWHTKTSKCSGLAGSSTKQMVFAERTSMQWCLRELRVSGAVSFPHRSPRKGDFILTLHLWFQRALQRAVRLDKWVKMVTQPFSDFFHSASTEENPAEMWEERLAGADFWKGLQWNLSALLPLLS